MHKHVHSSQYRLLLWLFPIAILLYRPAYGQTELATLPPFDNSAIEEQINATTIVVARMSNQTLMIPEIPQDMLGLSTRDALSTLNKNLISIREVLPSGVSYLLIDVPFTHAQVPVRLLLEKPSEDQETNLAAILDRSGMTILKETNFWIVSPSGDLAASQRNMVQPTILSNIRPELAAAFALVESYPIQIAVIPPAHIWKGYEEMMPALPPSLGGGPITRITNGVSWIAVGCNPATLDFDATIQSTTSQAATELANFLPTFLEKGTSLLAQTPFSNFQNVATTLLPRMHFTAKDQQIKVTITGIKDAITEIGPTSKLRVQELLAFNNRQTNDQLRQLLLGIHNYVSAFGALPPAIYKTSSGGTLLEPLDPLKAGYTTLLAPAGENTVFGNARPITFSHVTDGLSNTIMIVNVKPEKAVPWTAPLDFEYDPAAPVEGISLTTDLKFIAGFGDGSVENVPSNLPPLDLLHLFQMNDGNAVQW